jgi:PPM family protein phosphatase
LSQTTPISTPFVFPSLRWRWRGGFEAAYVSEAGKRQAQNQDSCIHAPSAHAPRFCGVADGVGGGAHGEVASSVFLQHCAHAVGSIFRDRTRLSQWVIAGDAKVRDAIGRLTDRPGATTAVGIWLLFFGKAHVVNIGDCRAYRVRPHDSRHSIDRITLDQTYQNIGEDHPPSGSPDDPARMVGVDALGTPSVATARIGEGDLLLLCSDGVHKFVPDAELAATIRAGLSKRLSLKDICSALVRAAKANGCDDDASALLVMRHSWFGVRGVYWWTLVAAALIWLISDLAIRAF